MFSGSDSEIEIKEEVPGVVSVGSLEDEVDIFGRVSSSDIRPLLELLLDFLLILKIGEMFDPVFRSFSAFTMVIVSWISI